MGAPAILAEDVYREELAKIGAEDGRVVCGSPARRRTAPLRDGAPGPVLPAGQRRERHGEHGRRTGHRRVQGVRVRTGHGYRSGAAAPAGSRPSADGCVGRGAGHPGRSGGAAADAARPDRGAQWHPGDQGGGARCGTVGTAVPHPHRRGGARRRHGPLGRCGRRGHPLGRLGRRRRLRAARGRGVCLVSVGEDGTRLALAARERNAGPAHAHLVYLDDSHLAAAAGELARHHDRFVVLGGYPGRHGVRQRLSRLMPGCAVLGVTPSGDLAADAGRVLSTVKGLWR